MLIGLSGAFDSGKKEVTTDDFSYNEYCAELEEKTESIIGSIDGVGECRVMLTLKNSSESIFAKNSEENTNDGNYSKNSEYVLYDSDNGEKPVLIKEYFPEVKGVVVVCSGADNTAVREGVISCISSLYGLPSTKISVIKLK
ncbi:MAG: hypothetical protein IJS03_05890 [Eubacterium sp.]|nr:hypothetical protein [Eubacterium sp.]